MNPAANASISAGVSGAFVVLLNWIMTISPHIGAMPEDVQAALTLLITAAIGYFLHRQTRDDPTALVPVHVGPADQAMPSTTTTIEPNPAVSPVPVKAK